MNTELTTYLLELTLVWTILLAYYHFMLRLNKQWSLRRRYLICSWLLGLCLPLLPTLYTFGGELSRQLPTQVLLYLVRPVAGPAVASSVGATDWSTYVLAAWLVGAIVCLIRVVVRLASHLRPRPLHVEQYAGFRVVRSLQVTTPYAAFRTIYLPYDLAPELEQTALVHEATHLRRGHHHKQLLLIIGTCALWFHPLAWYYLHLLTAVHEYEADAAVIQTISPRTYGQQLLQATLAPRTVPALFSSPLKQRIAMLTQPNSSSVNIQQWTFLLVLVVGLLLASSDVVRLAPTAPAVTLQDTYEPPVLLGKPDTMEATEYLARNVYEQIGYPAEARDIRATGTVYIMMNVDAEGNQGMIGTMDELPENVTAIEFVIVGYTAIKERTSYPENGASLDVLERESVRAASRLGKIGFTPARAEGEPVATTLHFAFKYMLED